MVSGECCRCCRTEALAAASEIKQTAYSPADVMTLFSAFQKQVSDFDVCVKARPPVVVRAYFVQCSSCFLPTARSAHYLWRDGARQPDAIRSFLSLSELDCPSKNNLWPDEIITNTSRSQLIYVLAWAVSLITHPVVCNCSLLWAVS